ncbi:MAG: sulfite exporter TauE/SafE family protein [Oligoflexia bacterium]|nr:sulfite exporter TauE/SafE family protein [Oligoflexia bacterium]
MLELAGYFSIALMGLVLGLMGAGGSILAVPILIYLFKLPPTQATLYSLFIVGIGAIAGAMPYARQKRVHFKQAFIFFVPSLLGVLTSRRIVLPTIPDSAAKNFIVLISFTLVMVAASLFMLLKKNPAVEKVKLNKLKTITSGFVVGLITGFVGVGGGFLIIPALVGGLNIPMQFAVGTSLVIIATNSLLGFFSDLIAGLVVPWPFLIKITFYTLAGIFVGTNLNKKIPADNLKKFLVGLYY